MRQFDNKFRYNFSHAVKNDDTNSTKLIQYTLFENLSVKFAKKMFHPKVLKNVSSNSIKKFFSNQCFKIFKIIV